MPITLNQKPDYNKYNFIKNFEVSSEDLKYKIKKIFKPFQDFYVIYFGKKLIGKN